jgi:hypothetical protein
VTTFCSLVSIINAAGAHAGADIAGMTVILDPGHNGVDDAYSAPCGPGRHISEQPSLSPEWAVGHRFTENTR